MIVNTHNPESCAFRGEEERQAFLDALDQFQARVRDHAVTIQGAWVSRVAHEIFILVDAPNAHAVEEVLLGAGMIGRTHSRVQPLVTAAEAFPGTWREPR